MKKDSSEQYLKYLAALSLTVAAPAVAAQQPVVKEETSSTATVQMSQNLQALANSIAQDDADSGCMHWPESTYNRVLLPTPPKPGPRLATVQAEAKSDASLTQLMDDVLGKLE